MKNPLLILMLAALFTTQYDFDTTETVLDVFANCPAGVEKRVLVERQGRKFILYVCKDEAGAARSKAATPEIEPLPEGAI